MFKDKECMRISYYIAIATELVKLSLGYYRPCVPFLELSRRFSFVFWMHGLFQYVQGTFFKTK